MQWLLVDCAPTVAIAANWCHGAATSRNGTATTTAPRGTADDAGDALRYRQATDAHAGPQLQSLGPENHGCREVV